MKTALQVSCWKYLSTPLQQNEYFEHDLFWIVHLNLSPLTASSSAYLRGLVLCPLDKLPLGCFLRWLRCCFTPFAPPPAANLSSSEAESLAIEAVASAKQRQVRLLGEPAWAGVHRPSTEAMGPHRSTEVRIRVYHASHGHGEQREQFRSTLLSSLSRQVQLFHQSQP